MFYITFGKYLFKIEKQIFEYLHILYHRKNMHNDHDIDNSRKNIVDGLFNEIDFYAYSDNTPNLTGHHRASIEMTEMKRLENDWKEDFDQIVKPSVDIMHGITVTNEIWNIILEYACTTEDNSAGYIRNKIDRLVKREKKMLMYLSIYAVFRMLLEVFVLFLAIGYYFDNRKLYSNEYDYDGWQEYQMLNATLCVSCFAPNLSIITLFATGICMYVWKKRQSKQIHMRILGIFVLCNLRKYLLQAIIGLPLYAVGLASFWPIIAIMPNVIGIGCRIGRNMGGHRLHIYHTILIVIYLSQHIFFVSFNILSGHAWFASSIRSFCGWDACYDNTILLDVVNRKYHWIELLVYVTYWLP